MRSSAVDHPLDRFTIPLAALVLAAAIPLDAMAAPASAAATSKEPVAIVGKVARPSGEAVAAEASPPKPVTPAPTGQAVSNTSAAVASPSQASPPGEAASRLDWNLLVPAMLSRLVVLVLAIACAILAHAAWKVLAQALPAAAKAPSPTVPRAEGDGFVFQRHWGGFGGSSTGWTVSDRLVRVVVGLALAALAASLGTQLVPQDAGRDDKPKAGPDAAASAANPGK